MKRTVVLAVDDAPDLLTLMARVLAKDYEVKTAGAGAAALIAAAAEPTPDLILLDVEMPGMSGFEVCKALKASPATSEIPVIFLTGKGETQDEMQGFVLGAADYITKPIKAAVLMARVGAHVALASRRAALEVRVRQRTAQLEAAHLELIRCLSRAMEFHESAAVGNRFQRLSQYAKLVSEALGAKPNACEMMFKAAPLHDLGKIALPADVLRRPGKLSAPDWERVRRHCEYGAAIIGEHDDPLLKLARVVALTHHENWDGSGYPKRLKGEAIPWPGRVMAVVDAYESMTTTQFYRAALTPQQAGSEILHCAGSRYDPAVVEAFRKAQPAMRKVRVAIADDLDQVINLDFSQTAVMKLAPVKPAPKRA